MATRTVAEGAKDQERCAARAGRKNEVWTREGGWKDGGKHKVMDKKRRRQGELMAGEDEAEIGAGKGGPQQRMKRGCGDTATQ